MFENLNIPAAIIFILVAVGIIALAIYKRRKNDESYTVDKFINENYYNLVNALSNVIEILLINVEDYPDKESYEKDIIRVTIGKLEDNCEQFGIDPVLFRLVNIDMLTTLLYNILHSERIALFTNAVPQNVIENNANLYDADVVEASKELAVAEDEKATEEASAEAGANTAFIPELDTSNTDMPYEESIIEEEANDNYSTEA